MKNKKMKCPKCGEEKIGSCNERSVYACGSYGYKHVHGLCFQSSDCRDRADGKKILTRIKYFILIKLGKCCCSGYGVYPNGIKCCGCEDCRKTKLEE